MRDYGIGHGSNGHHREDYRDEYGIAVDKRDNGNKRVMDVPGQDEQHDYM